VTANNTIEPAAPQARASGERPLRRWGMIVLGAVFLGGAVLENIPGVSLPLGGLHLWLDWDMFSKPTGARATPVVMGTPRDGGEDVVVVDPADRPAAFLDRLRDSRQRKLHEQISKPTTMLAAKRGYLEYVCAEHGARFASLKLRTRGTGGKLGLVVAERQCN
jgi:hypothetical protein